MQVVATEAGGRVVVGCKRSGLLHRWRWFRDEYGAYGEGPRSQRCDRGNYWPSR